MLCGRHWVLVEWIRWSVEGMHDFSLVSLTTIAVDPNIERRGHRNKRWRDYPEKYSGSASCLQNGEPFHALEMSRSANTDCIRAARRLVCGTGCRGWRWYNIRRRPRRQLVGCSRENAPKGHPSDDYRRVFLEGIGKGRRIPHRDSDAY
jgi:hypothetical protein